MAKCDTRELQALAQRLRRAASDEQRQAFYEACCRELAARFLAKVIKRTPVGKGQFEVERAGREYRIIITNPVKYASYVEYGHRQTPGRFIPVLGKRTKAGWVKGQFMMTLSEQELVNEAPGIMAKKLEAFLRGVMGGK